MEPGEILIGDSNTGWSQHAAVRVVAAVRDLDCYIEQPCLTYQVQFAHAVLVSAACNPWLDGRNAWRCAG